MIKRNTRLNIWFRNIDGLTDGARSRRIGDEQINFKDELFQIKCSFSKLKIWQMENSFGLKFFRKPEIRRPSPDSGSIFSVSSSGKRLLGRFIFRAPRGAELGDFRGHLGCLYF
jgi:hypothetical protein